MSIRVLLVDDHELFLEGLKELIHKAPNMELVGQARDGRQAVDLALELRPDVILMDMTMPGLNGIQATREIIGGGAEVRVLILSMHSDREFIVESLRAGAQGTS